ncbi:hypothetical protein FS837_007112 [Tulasnella sp. UAMH 9824]|nr:hypothetical protein FS837_007112 [Tulasnella sp. UAMH 9824]
MSTAARKPAPRIARPAQRYWKGKAPKGADAAQLSDSDEDEEQQVAEEELPEDMPLGVVVGDESSQNQKLKKKMGAMNVALKDVNIDSRGKVIVAGKEESGRTVMEEEEESEESEEEEEEEESGSSEEESSEEEEEEELKPKLQFRPVFVPKRNRATVAEREADDPYNEEAVAKREQEAEQRKKDSHNLVAESIKRELAEKEAEDIIPDVDDTDGLDPQGEFEAWRLRELGRIKRDKEAQRARELEREEIERRRAMPEEQRMKEDMEHAKKSRDDKPKGQQKFLQKYYHKGAFHQDAEILKRHDYTEATESTLDVSMLPKVMQVKDFGKRGRTKYTHLLDQDTTRVGTDGKGGGAICFLCGGPHLKKDCPSNPLNGGEGPSDAATGSNSVAGPPTKKFGIGSRQAQEESRRNDRGEITVILGEEGTATIAVVMTAMTVEEMTGTIIGREVRGTMIVRRGGGRGRIHHRAGDTVEMMEGGDGQGRGRWRGSGTQVCNDSLSATHVAPSIFYLDSFQNGINPGNQFMAQEDTSGSLGDERVCSKLQRDTPSKTIDDLPPEVLVRIIDAVLNDITHLPYFLGGYYLTTLKDLAAVCKWWKTTIQSTPTFWTIIESTTTPDEMEYMLRKSGNCPLTFRQLIDSTMDVFPTGGVDGFDFLDFASLNMARCSSLSVAVKWCEQAARVLKSPAPKLRAATIVASVCNMDEDVHLFNGEAGELEDLWLSQIPIRWDLGLPTKLRWVEISYRSVPITRLPHPQQIVSGLSSCPKIEVVRLIGADMPFQRLNWTGLEVQMPTLELPMLKELKLENMSVGGSGYILRSLWSPVLRNLEVKERSQFGSVAALLHPPCPLLVESVRRALPPSRLFSVTVESVRVDLQISGGGSHVGISVRCGNPDELSGWLAEEFAAELFSVSELRLRVSSTRHQSEFRGLRKLVEALKNVERLICLNVDGGAGVVLTEHLSSPHQAGDGWYWHWPRLTHMELGDAWKWPKLALTMIRERYGTSDKEPESLDIGGLKRHAPSPLTRLWLDGMKATHPETFQDIERIVGKKALEDHVYDDVEYDGRDSE